MTSASEDRWRDLRPDPENDTPLYLQLARKLGAAIHENRWNAGEALPSERVLSEALGVSRITSRKAIALLVEQGLIRRTQGAGSLTRLPSGCMSNCMNTWFQISMKRSPSSPGLPGGPPGMCAPWS